MSTVGETPIKKRKEHRLYDSRKIEAFQDCPRKFFFRYVLGWKSETRNIHRAFGNAWTKAMTFLHTRGMSDEQVEVACAIFEEAFEEEYPSSLRFEHPSTNPENGKKGLREYANYVGRSDDIQVMSTEVSGSVPIGNDRTIHFDCDLICRDDRGQIWGLQHEITSQGDSVWKRGWDLDFSVNATAYAVSDLLADEDDEVEGVKINGAILPSDGNNEFMRIPCRKERDHLDLWRKECNHWIDMIEQNWEILKETKVSDSTMHAFPRNPTSCTKDGCKFEDKCANWLNPLQKCEEPPVGYKEDHWRPDSDDE